MYGPNVTPLRTTHGKETYLNVWQRGGQKYIDEDTYIGRGGQKYIDEDTYIGRGGNGSHKVMSGYDLATELN